MSSARIDRLFELLPVVYRQRDEESHHALRDLLRIIAEQVGVIEDDIAQLYENWFIETCAEWVVPYIGDLVGYTSSERRGVANYLRDLRRRGTLALLEELSLDIGSFSAHATEYYTLLGRLQQLNHLDQRGTIADLRNAEAMDLIDGPFDSLARTAELRGRHNIPDIGVWLWRLRSYPITHAPAYFVQRSSGYFFFTFSALGNDAPIFTKAEREPDLATIAGELNVPTPIRRRALEKHLDQYYGRSFSIWLDKPDNLVPASDIIAADLSNWEYRPPDGKIAVDPILGRIALSREPDGMWVSYHYGFTADAGAHESARVLKQPRGAKLYCVGVAQTLLSANDAQTLLSANDAQTLLSANDAQTGVSVSHIYPTINDALEAWRKDNPQHAVVEIIDSGFYTEMFDVELAKEQTLQIRAANRKRPVIRVLDYNPQRGEALSVILDEHARFTLDGLLVAGRPLRVEGAGKKAVDARVVLRRCTFVPGWSLHPNCDPAAPDESSVDVRNLSGRVTIERCILGTIAVMDKTNESEPLRIDVSDSIVDATSLEREAVVGPGSSYAWATLTIARCTIFGTIETHAIELGENSIFAGVVHVVRRQLGCLRFCSVPPGSRTPKRYHCTELEAAFNSVRFGKPDYAQLAFDCPAEIARGADDESEMGAFHDAFLPQRTANLRARLEQSTAAGMETGIIFAD